MKEKELNGHEKRIYSVSCSPDGKIIASAGFDCKIILWNIENGAIIKILEG